MSDYDKEENDLNELNLTYKEIQEAIREFNLKSMYKQAFYIVLRDIYREKRTVKTKAR